MTKNPILDELHKTRERMLAEAGGTLAGLVASLQQDERLSGREIVHPKSQTKRCTGAAKSGVLAVENPLSPPG
jgi:hypothetical protein